MSAVFRYDFNSPYAYLAATRVDEVLGGDVRWEPIAFGFMLAAQQRVPWSSDTHGERAAGVAECERRAAEYGLPELRWPAGWPRESWTLSAMRAAAAARLGAVREFSLAAFSQLWAHGVPMTDPDFIVLAARNAGINEAAVLEGVADPDVKERLRHDTDAAVAAGVPGVPTVTVGTQHFWGDDRLEDAAAAMHGDGR